MFAVLKLRFFNCLALEFDNLCVNYGNSDRGRVGVDRGRQFFCLCCSEFFHLTLNIHPLIQPAFVNHFCSFERCDQEMIFEQFNLPNFKRSYDDLWF